MKPRQDRLLWGAVLACALSIYVYPLALPTPLLDPDEGLHAAIAQEMVENGDYGVPRVQGEPFLDKPVLFFAAQALSLKTFGMSAAAARFPGFLFALLGVATTALLARQLFDSQTGLVAALVALTLPVPFSIAQGAVHDVALVPWTNLLLLCWWEADRGNSNSRRALLVGAAALLVALALLTKGLIGVAVVSVGYILFVLISRQLSLWLVTRLVAGLLLGMLLACPWFIFMETRAPGYLWYYFVERHVGGFATESQLHGGAPWYYYFPILIGGAIPWIFYLGPGLWQTWIARRQGRTKEAQAVLFVLCWLVGGLLFLSIASSKLTPYALPLFPAVAILVGHYFKWFLDHRLAKNVDITFTRIFQFTCVTGGLAPVAALVVADLFTHARSPTLAYLMASLASATMLVAFYWMRQGRRHAAVAIGTLWFALLFISMMTWPLQRSAEQYAQRSLGLELAQCPELPRQIVLVDGRVGSVVFYLTPAQRRQLQPGQITTASPAAIDRWSTIAQDTLLVMTPRALAKIHHPAIKRLAESGIFTGHYRLIQSPATLAQKQEERIW